MCFVGYFEEYQSEISYGQYLRMLDIITYNVLGIKFLKMEFIILIRENEHPLEIDLMGIDYVEYSVDDFSRNY